MKTNWQRDSKVSVKKRNLSNYTIKIMTAAPNNIMLSRNRTNCPYFAPDISTSSKTNVLQMDVPSYWRTDKLSQKEDWYQMWIHWDLPKWWENKIQQQTSYLLHLKPLTWLYPFCINKLLGRETTRSRCVPEGIARGCQRP